MGQRLFKWSAAASAGVGVVAFVLWARSYFHADYVYFGGPVTTDLYSEACSLQIDRTPVDTTAGGDWGYLHFSGPFGNEWPRRWVLARVWGRFDWSSGATFHASLPHWVVFACAAVLPAVWIARYGYPRWARYALPAAFALWPVELAVLVFPFAWCNGVGLVITSGLLATALLAARDFVRVAVRAQQAPWPWQWRQARAYRREQQGQCRQCGYDLRATRDRCPECGAVAGLGVRGKTA